MATNFYTGLASGLDKANEIQRQDEAERMARDRAQALEIQRDVENQRANERMGMERERITRANALSDFQLTEAQRKSAEEIEIKDGFKKIHEQIYAPKKVMGPDGAEVDITPDPKDPKLASEYTAAMTQHMAKFGLLKPADRKVLMETDRWVQQTGLEDSFRELIATRGLSAASRAAVAPKLGLDPNAPVSLEVDDTGPFKRTFVLGTSADGTPFKQEATWIAAALGMRDADPDAPGRKFALDAAKIKRDEAGAEANDELAKLRGRTDPNIRGTRGAAPETVEKQIERLHRIATGPAGKLNGGYSPLMADALVADKPDANKLSWVLDRAEDMIEKDELTPRQAWTNAINWYNKLEQTALTGKQWVQDKNPDGKGGAWRIAKEGEKGRPFASVPLQERQSIRDRLVNDLDQQARRAAEARKQQQK